MSNRISMTGPAPRLPHRVGAFLLMPDVSELALGGVPVFNMEIARGLAMRHDVTLLTVDPDPS
ncbi:hypothetical protein ACWD4B_03035 [Streptomyces sp. NPDC002536]